MVEAIEYWSNAADDAFPTRLTVARAGLAELEVMSNEDNPAMPIIGRFSTATDARMFEQIAKAVMAPGFAKHVNPGPVEPGEVIRRINVRFSDGHEVKRHVAGSAAANAGFAEAEKEALRMIGEVRRHPRQALALVMTVSPGTGRDRQILEIALSNAGSDPVALPHPNQWMQSGMAFHVTARRSDVPLAQMSNEHQTFLELGQDALTAAPASTAPRITLAPGQRQIFSFDARLPLAPGKYEIWGAFIARLFNEQGNEVMLGELVSPRMPISR